MRTSLCKSYRGPGILAAGASRIVHGIIGTRLIGDGGIGSRGNESVLNARWLLEICGEHAGRARFASATANGRDSENVPIVNGENVDDRVETNRGVYPRNYLAAPILRYRDWNCALPNPFTARHIYAIHASLLMCVFRIFFSPSFPLFFSCFRYTSVKHFRGAFQWSYRSNT